MKKAKKLIVGNWKMNPETLEEAREIAASVKRTVKSLKRTEIVLCPPFVFLPALLSAKTKSLSVGAQNVFQESAGPYTGEVSSKQLSNLGTEYVIAGHSERRARGENDEMISKKVRRIVGDSMTAILCVGEHVRDTHGDYLEIIKNQLVSGLKFISKKSLEQIVIAYEPVWAVGKSVSIESGDLHEMTIYIRKVLRDMYGMPADLVQILYGGDVTALNCAEIISAGNVSGLLIGRESLRAKNFIEIAKIADSI